MDPEHKAYRKGDEYMFKRLNGLLGLCLGMALSVGAGAGLGGVHNEAVGVKAASIETLTIDGDKNTPASAWGTNYSSDSSGEKYATTSGNNKIYLKYSQVGRMNTSIQIAKNTSNGFWSVSCPDGNYVSSVKLTVKTNTATLSMSADGTTWSTITYTSGTEKTFTVDNDYKYFKVNATTKYCQITSFVATYTQSKSLKDLEVTDNSGRTTWHAGEVVKTNDLSVVPVFDDESKGTAITDGTDVYFDKDSSVTEYTLKEGENAIIVYYKGAEGIFSITAKAARTLQSLTLSEYKTTFEQGDDFDFGGKVMANYDTGDPVDVTDDAKFSGYDLSKTGEQTVTVSYGGITTEYKITVTKVLSFTFKAGTDKSSTASLANSVITLEGESGSCQFNNDSYYGIYKGSTLTISTNSEKITGISLTATKNGASQYGPGCFTLVSGGGEYSYETEGTGGSWASSIGAKEIVLKASSSQVRIVSITINLTEFTAQSEAVAYSVYFKANIGCDSDGAKAPTGWTDVKAQWSNLTTDAQTYLKNADTSTETDADILECIRTYEYIVNKYNSKDPTTYNDFMGRGIAVTNASNALYRASDGNTPILVVILVATVSVTAIGGYFFIRKRKYN